MSAPLPEEVPLSSTEQQWVESVVTRQRTNPFLVAGGLLAAFGVYRKVMQSWLESEPNKTYAAANLNQVLFNYWSRFAPQWRTMAEAFIYQAVARGVKESGITLPEAVMTSYVAEYTRTLGEYIHQTTVEAAQKGFNALTNRRLPNLSALAFITTAIGVTPRVMNSLVNVWTSEDPKAYTDIKQPSQRKRRATRIINAGINQRAEAIGGHEEWNAKEQAKEIAWQYAVLHGILPATARRKWVTADDEKVCVYCGGLDGAEVRVKEQFETDAGAFWSPPLHPNCRCTVKLVSSVKRILRGAMKRQKIVKAELRPWLDQPRDEDGQWTKTATATRSPLILPPVADEKLTLPPPGSAPASQLRLPPPAQKLELPQRLELPSDKLELPQDVSLQLPSEKLELPAPKVAEQLKLPEPAEPELDMPEVVFDTEDIAVSSMRAMNPRGYVHLQFMEEAGKRKPAYGVLPSDYDISEMHTYRPNGLRMVHDWDSLNEMVQDEISNEVDTYIAELLLEHGGDGVPVFTENGAQAYATYNTLHEAFEWLRARDQRMHTVEYGTPQSGPIYENNHFVQVDVGGELRSVRASTIVNTLQLDEMLDSFRPTVVTTDRFDPDKTEVELGAGYHDETEYVVNGPHEVIEMSDHVLSPEGEVIPAYVYEITPFDYRPDTYDDDDD